MQSKSKCLRESKLYLILDAQVNSHAELLDILKKSVHCGVDIVQLRDKCGRAKDILDFSRKAMKIVGGRIPYIINDRADLAILADADGVHLGQDDIPVPLARKMLGVKKIIGTSCQTLAHARAAEKDGADYMGFGSVFKTQTKPGRSAMDLKLLGSAVRKVSIPLFAIGGISHKNIGMLLPLGVSRVAVCRDICESRDVETVVRKIKQALG
jgi:thiamine-phosphate pyrophosphorylase